MTIIDENDTEARGIFARLGFTLSRRESNYVIPTDPQVTGLPLDPRVTYIVTARHPLDMAVSLYHQGDNVDRALMRRLTGQPEPAGPPRPRRPLRDWLLDWINEDADPRQEMDSLPGVMWHLSDAWARRAEPNVLIVHYDRLSADLESEMRRIATQLGIAMPAHSWPSLVEAANMRAKAEQLVPGGGVLKSSAAFFRRGSSGAGREVLTTEDIAGYYARAALKAPADMLSWLHACDFGAVPSPNP